MVLHQVVERTAHNLAQGIALGGCGFSEQVAIKIGYAARSSQDKCLAMNGERDARKRLASGSLYTLFIIY